jgi:membrane associated rhomboid family serine protease
VIFPVSHERMTARRWPIVTTLIFFACFFAQLSMSLAQDRPIHGPSGAETRAIQYFTEHPYLDVQPGKLPLLDQDAIELSHKLAQTTEMPDDDTQRAEQRTLDALVAKVDAAPPDDPLRRWGYIPAEHNGLGLLTSPFVHAGWWHLAGNMGFLFFCGMTLEDRWGRVVFPLFYVAAGAVAALVHGGLDPHSTVPLVGASGAIAGCMGAFTVAFARTRVRFLFMLTLRPRTFTAPAYTVLPIWAAFEFVQAFLFRGDGTAHWAHVGGFAFGVVVGLLLHRTGWDQRLDDAVEVASVLGGDPRIDEARRLLRMGRGDEATAMLEGLAIERPDSAVVQEALAEIASALGDASRADAARKRAARLRATAS